MGRLLGQAGKGEQTHTSLFRKVFCFGEAIVLAVSGYYDNMKISKTNDKIF